jgi:hypothetical protein
MRRSRLSLCCPDVIAGMPGLLVSFARRGRSQVQSFPRKRESTPSSSHFQWLAE